MLLVLLLAIVVATFVTNHPRMDAVGLVAIPGLDPPEPMCIRLASEDAPRSELPRITFRMVSRRARSLRDQGICEPLIHDKNLNRRNAPSSPPSLASEHRDRGVVP
jgi:hypothetical protein